MTSQFNGVKEIGKHGPIMCQNYVARVWKVPAEIEHKLLSFRFKKTRCQLDAQTFKLRRSFAWLSEKFGG